MRLFFLKILFILFTLSNFVFADQVKKIEVSGNNRVTNQTIYSIANIKLNEDYSLNQLNNFQKKLFQSNFFKSVDLKLKNNILYINVIENPIIDFYYIKGVTGKLREDFFYNNLQLGPNKIFSEYLLKSDVEKIKDNYLDSGYLDVKVIPEISKISGNSLNLILNIEEGKSYKVNRVFFTGNKFFKPSTLLDVISTSEHSWWKFLSSSSSYNKKRIEYDKSLLKEFYLDNGFYDIQIMSADSNFIESQGVNISYSIDSGGKYTFSNFVIKDEEKNLREKDIKSIENIIKKFLQGQYSISLLRKTQDKIYKYLELSKIEFVQLNVTEVKKNNNIDIIFIFYKSNRAYINLIKVRGNSITEEKVIRNNLYLSEGDSFSNKKLTNSIKNLKNTGIFADVDVKTKKIDRELIDLDINVEEQPTGSISAGIGVGSSESSVGGSLQEKNLFGKGIISNIDFKVGTQKISGSINVINPEYKDTGSKLGTSLFAVTTDFDNAGYESKKIGSSIFLEHDILEDISLRYGFGLDLDKINTSENASTLYKSREGNYLTYKSFYNIDNDKRNRRFKPTSGHKAGFGQSLAMPGSDITYINNNVYGAFYHEYKKDYVLNLKGGIDTINSLGNEDIKLSDRKFLSNKKIRGFESFGIGPKDGKDHIGGNYSFYSSIASTFPNPFPEKWNADSIVFIDAANVWGVDYDSSKNSDKLRSSAGLVLDWTSPLGPLSFTYAETLSSADGDKKESFSFQIGSTF